MVENTENIRVYSNTKFLPRKIYPQLKDHLDKRQTTVLTGMRRTGKTTLLKQLLSDIDSDNKAFIDLQNIQSRNMFNQANYDLILADIIGEFKLRREEKIYIAIDEIQLVRDLPGIMKYLYDHYDVKFMVTGSSSYYMKNLFTESMAGRKRLFELYPLDFGEFLNFKSVRRGDPEDFTKSMFSPTDHERLRGYYDEYIEYGGFPEVVLEENAESKKSLLSDIISAYIDLDVQSMSDFRKKDDFYSLIKLLAARTGSRIDYAKLSRISGISKITLQNYLLFLEDTYLIKRLPVFTHRTETEIVKARKLYFIDNGLVNALADIDSGSKFENAVFNQLRHKGEMGYYAIKGGREIDFIVGEKIAFEVKETPIKNDLAELASLANMAKIKEYRLIGKNQSPKFDDYIWGGSIR
jgi:predicted AAA+ superfamily ATPase